MKLNLILLILVTVSFFDASTGQVIDSGSNFSKIKECSVNCTQKCKTEGKHTICWHDVSFEKLLILLFHMLMDILFQCVDICPEGSKKIKYNKLRTYPYIKKKV